MNIVIGKVGSIRKKINRSSRMVYMILVGLSHDGEVSVYYDDLTSYAGLSTNSVSSAIKELCDKNLIDHIGRGRYTIN